MRTKDFIKAIAEESNQTIVATEKFYEAFMRLLEDRIVAGEDVTFRNLFTVKNSETAARQVKCGFDGKIHDIPAGRKLTYKTSKVLKDKLNGK